MGIGGRRRGRRGANRVMAGGGCNGVGGDDGRLMRMVVDGLGGTASRSAWSRTAEEGRGDEEGDDEIGGDEWREEDVCPASTTSVGVIDAKVPISTNTGSTTGPTS